MIEVRPFGAADRTIMQDIARRAWPRTIRHPGGLAWSMATLQLAELIIIVEQDGVPVAWAGITQPGGLQTQSISGDPQVARAIASWGLGELDGEAVRVPLTVDDTLLPGLLKSGFRMDTEADPVFGMFHPATEVAPALSQYAVRSAATCDVDTRVEVHRRAWKPADLPWHPDHRPATPPDAESSYDRVKHDRVRRMPLYDEALDLIVVSPNGSPAACCLVWFDPELGVAEIEPLGVVPEHRRQGLAGLLCQEAVRQVAMRGGREVLISAGPREAYPANSGAYAKAGFAVQRRGSIYLLQR